MAVPPFKAFFRPFLDSLSGGDAMNMPAIRSEISARLNCASVDLSARTPSGSATTFADRVGWARTYLFKAGLIKRVSRGTYSITGAGLEVLASHPTGVSIEDLSLIPAFRDWRSGTGVHAEGGAPSPTLLSSIGAETGTLDEVMARSEIQLRNLVEEELRQRLMEMTPGRFEYLVEQLVVKLGYGSSDTEVRAALGGGHGDGGVDGVISQDRLGLGQIYLQAKRWESKVGRPDLQHFVGAMHGKAQKGVFITSSDFSAEAENYARTLSGIKLRLINGAELVSLMVDCALGVVESRVYRQFRIDSDFFSDEE